MSTVTDFPVGIAAKMRDPRESDVRFLNPDVIRDEALADNHCHATYEPAGTVGVIGSAFRPFQGRPLNGVAQWRKNAGPSKGRRPT